MLLQQADDDTGNLMIAPKSSFLFNAGMVIGLALVVLSIAIAIIGPSIAPRDPMEQNLVIKPGETRIMAPPFPPGTPGYILGSDMFGRDTLSRLLWAVRPTLLMALFIATARLLVGTSLGAAEGWFATGRAGDVARSLREFGASIPLLLFSIVLLFVFQFQSGSIWAFVIALSVTGWTGTALIVAERVRLVRREPYIEATRALGAGEWHILVKHVVPQINTLLPIILSLEMGSVLLILAELGFLGFYAGGRQRATLVTGNSATMDLPIMIPGFPELGQMLSNSWTQFFQNPFLTIVTGTVFLLTIFGFMMLGESLKRRVMKGNFPTPRFSLSRLFEPAPKPVTDQSVEGS
jgi:ABC-type dipeptide/oligopeptide/nickel transport system permease subunit